MTMLNLPEETKRTRKMVDALREFIGLAPLYYQGSANHTEWLTKVSDSYAEMRPSRNKPKGSRT
jgi:hypothetical protein